MKRVALVLVVAAVAAACSGDAGTEPSPIPQPTYPNNAPVAGSAAEARERLCTRPGALPASSQPAEGATPDNIRQVMSVIEDLRGLEFTEPVIPEPVTRTDLDARLEDGFDAMFPRELYSRRGLAWATVGAIPVGTDLYEAYHRFFNVAVIGFYDTLSGELVFLGTEDPMPEERVTLAHELVHALEDQVFDLSRIDALLADCQEEAFQAALAVVEGSATYHMVRYADTELTRQERSTLGGGAPEPEVPPFLLYEMRWPYDAGYGWAKWAVDNRELDPSLREFPTTTEQILHPEREDGPPTPLDIPDLGPALGAGWSDLDVQDAGESWLASLIGLRLEWPTAEGAAGGWDGGLMRSWSDGERVAVVLETAWDSLGDAKEFTDAMERYGEGEPIAVVRTTDDRVRVLFASDEATLDLLRSAAA